MSLYFEHHSVVKN